MKAQKPKDVRRDIIRLHSGKKLVKQGNGYTISVPKLWVALYAYKMDGGNWVRLNQESPGVLTISALNQDEIEDMMKVNDVSPSEEDRCGTIW